MGTEFRGASWSTTLSSVFVVLGVLIAFLQWVVPRSPTEPKLSSAISNETQKIRQSYSEEIKSKLKNGTAALIIYTGKHNKNNQFSLVNTDAGRFRYYVPKLRENVGRINRSDYGAVFLDVPPSDYFISIWFTADRPWFGKVLDFVIFVSNVRARGIKEDSGPRYKDLETVKLTPGEIKEIYL